MSSLINKHILLGTPEKPEFNLDWVLTKLDRCCSDCLTKREIEICARIIIGYTSDTIAQDLHISANTVLSHRRNAYEKLNIRTQNQLFAILIDGLPKKGH